MIIHPDLRALRGDDAPQRAAQAALRRVVAGWRAQEPAASVLRAIDAFAGGCAIDEQPALAALFAPGAAARRLVEGFCGLLAGAIRAEPLGHVPLRHFTDGLTSTLLLARARDTTLALVATDGAALRARPLATTVDFGPSETWEHVLAGTATAEAIDLRSVDAQGAALDRRRLVLRPGMIVMRDARRQALQLRDVAGSLVVLRLQRRHGDAAVTREYRLGDGKLIHQAAGNPRDSRIELTMALLGRLGRADASPHLANIARAPGSAGLRWQALRECLSLDTRAGFEALCAIAQAPADALAPAAVALRAQLIEAHPQLGELEPCPA